MKNYEAVLFDLDGTLLDTLADLTEAVNAVLSKFHYPKKTALQVRRVLGNGLEQTLRLSLPPHVTKTQFQEMFLYFRKYYIAHCNVATKPYDGIPELLEGLQRRGIKMAIVSNKTQPAVKELARLYFPDTISTAIGESPLVKRKPAPDTVLAALKELNVDPQEAMYVGDSEVDKETADRAGLDCILVSWGFRDREDLAALNPAFLVDRPEEIAKLV